MPNLNYSCDPWEVQFLEGHDVSNIPLCDVDAWKRLPAYRQWFNKLYVAHRTGQHAAPHGVPIQKYPVVSKPIYNFWGMGMGAKTINRPEDFVYTPGHFWVQYLYGDHVSIDYFIRDGIPYRAYKAKLYPLTSTISVPQFPTIDSVGETWECSIGDRILKRFQFPFYNDFSGYTGIVNVEYIESTPIEVHLRPSLQFADLFEGYMEELVSLYNEGMGLTIHPYHEIYTGYSSPVWTNEGDPIRPFKQEDLDWLRTMVDEKFSIQPMFTEHWGEAEANPPGKTRVMVINSKHLEVNEKIEALLRFRRVLL